MKRNRDAVFSLKFLSGKRQGVNLLLQRSHIGRQFLFFENPSLLLQGAEAVIFPRPCKKILIHNPDVIFRDVHAKILVEIFDLLHLSCIRPSPGIHNAVTGKIIVRRTLGKIASIGEIFLSVTIFCKQRLIDKIPDESALITGLLFLQIDILVHPPVGIAHGVCKFTEKERLPGMGFQKFPHLPDRCIHLRIHITDFRIPCVMRNPFIMHKAIRIQLLKTIGHGLHHRPAVRFVAIRPEKDGGMILVSLIAGIHAVEHHFPVFLPVSRNRKRLRSQASCHLIPDSMRLQIVLRNHIDAIFVTKSVQIRGIRIVRSADGIDVVPLHGQDVLQHLFFGRHSAMITGKLMPVDSVKNQPLSIQTNQAVLDFDSPKSHFLPNDFL